MICDLKVIVVKVLHGCVQSLTSQYFRSAVYFLCFCKRDKCWI